MIIICECIVLHITLHRQVKAVKAWMPVAHSRALIMSALSLVRDPKFT